MPGGIGPWAATPRPLRKIEIISSKSSAMEMAWRSLRARSELPRPPGRAVEGHVQGGGRDRGLQRDSAQLNVLGQRYIAGTGDLHHLVEGIR